LNATGFKIFNGNSEPILAASPGMFGGTDLYFYHYPVFIADKDYTRIRFRNPDDDTKYHDVICDSNGIRFLKNGSAHGITATLPSGARPIVENGLIVGYVT